MSLIYALIQVGRYALKSEADLDRLGKSAIRLALSINGANMVGVLFYKVLWV